MKDFDQKYESYLREHSESDLNHAYDTFERERSKDGIHEVTLSSHLLTKSLFRKTDYIGLYGAYMGNGPPPTARSQCCIRRKMLIMSTKGGF